jgi:hypothetical protein
MASLVSERSPARRQRPRWRRAAHRRKRAASASRSPLARTGMSPMRSYVACQRKRECDRPFCVVPAASQCEQEWIVDAAAREIRVSGLLVRVRRPWGLTAPSGWSVLVFVARRDPSRRRKLAVIRAAVGNGRLIAGTRPIGRTGVFQLREREGGGWSLAHRRRGFRRVGHMRVAYADCRETLRSQAARSWYF